MNSLASTRCAGRLLAALAVTTSILLISSCGSSSNSIKTNPQGFSNSSLSGTYVISISGTDVNESDEGVPFAIAGTITTDGNGNITGGTVDVNDPGNTGVFLGQTAGGSYSIGQDGRGSGTLTTSSAGSFTIDFVLTSTSHGLISRFDSTGSGSGTIDLQSSVTTLSSNSYAFSLAGADPSGNPLATVGGFTVSSNNISGQADFNDDGTSGEGYANLILSGQLALGSSNFATAQLNTNTANSGLASLSFDVFVIDSTHLKFIENDTSDSGVILAGDAYTEASSFTAGQVVFTFGGIDGSQDDLSVGGYATIDANGNLTNGIEDYNDSGTVVLGKPFSSSAASCNGQVVSARPEGVPPTGRCQITLSGFSNGASQSFVFAVYPSTNGGQALEIDSFGLLQGSVFAQSATAFSAAGYGLNMSGANANGEVDDIAQFDATAAATSNMSGTLDENNLATDLVTAALSGAYTPDSPVDGRGSISATTNGTDLGGITLQYYVIDANTVAFIDADSTTIDAGQLGVGIFEAQTTPTADAARARHAVSIIHPMVHFMGGKHAAKRRK